MTGKSTWECLINQGSIATPANWVDRDDNDFRDQGGFTTSLATGMPTQITDTGDSDFKGISNPNSNWIICVAYTDAITKINCEL